jgi:hypothetical protein
MRPFGQAEPGGGAYSYLCLLARLGRLFAAAREIP